MKAVSIKLLEKSSVEVLWKNGKTEIKKARGILMQPWGITATLNGKKTVTRRIISPQPHIRKNNFIWNKFIYGQGDDKRIWNKLIKYCPKGQPGDLLYIREPFFLLYQSSCEGTQLKKINQISYKQPINTRKDLVWKKKPSIHMPREVARYWLLIVNVRIEQIQDISDDAVFDEGINEFGHETEDGEDYYWKVPAYWKNPDGKISKELYVDHFRDAFANLWDSINANRKDRDENILPYSWEDNPWVWVIEYKHIFTGRGINGNI